ILAATLDSSTVGTVTDTTMSITVIGDQPGNIPITCKGDWTFTRGVDPEIYAALKCDDPNVHVDLNQVQPQTAHPGIEIALGVSST
ncbi:MAG: hypothetical protein Q9168_008064, partial [Polycauliona sp. 1 TL-2023]